jgi:hypothetical protein
VALVVNHHDRKAKSADWLLNVSGSHGLAGSADSVLLLTRERGRADGRLRGTGRDISDIERALTFEDGRWSLLPGPGESYTASDTRARILRLLDARPDLTPRSRTASRGCRTRTRSGRVAQALQGGGDPPNPRNELDAQAAHQKAVIERDALARLLLEADRQLVEEVRAHAATAMSDIAERDETATVQAQGALADLRSALLGRARARHAAGWIGAVVDAGQAPTVGAPVTLTIETALEPVERFIGS